MPVTSSASTFCPRSKWCAKRPVEAGPRSGSVGRWAARSDRASRWSVVEPGQPQLLRQAVTNGATTSPCRRNLRSARTCSCRWGYRGRRLVLFARPRGAGALWRRSPHQPSLRLLFGRVQRPTGLGAFPVRRHMKLPQSRSSNFILRGHASSCRSLRLPHRSAFTRALEPYRPSHRCPGSIQVLPLRPHHLTSIWPPGSSSVHDSPQSAPAARSAWVRRSVLYIDTRYIIPYATSPSPF